MSEEKLPEEHKGEDRGYTPASPLKRTMAWIALAYVLILLALTTYYFYTGTTLGNLAPLLTVPGLIGLGALALVSWRSTGRPRKWLAILLAILCWLAAWRSWACPNESHRRHRSCWRPTAGRWWKKTRS